MNTKPKIFFPYGLSNWEQVATQGYTLVDKTLFVERLESEKQKQIAFLRPRRIGKSLFVSILEYYYDRNTKHKFDQLFGKYYIGQNPTPLANSFHVLKMDFSGIDTNTQENSFSGFLFKVRGYLNNFMRKYQLFTEQERQMVVSQTSPAKTLQAFFDLYGNTQAPIYLIIDEYDHFTNEILIRDLTEFKKSVSQDGYVRKFYEIVKEATQQGIVDRFFITGVSPITLDSLTSGFNIVKHLSHSLNFHDMMGFTEQETQDLLLLVLEDESRLELIMNDLRKYYNGYKFNTEAKQTVYNSNMVLYFLDEFKNSQNYPRQILDPNIMPDYGKLKKMFEVASWQDNIEVLETILENGEISSPQIFQFIFEQNFGKIEFVNFLYYMGNMTIKKDNGLSGAIFKIPNQVIADLYWKYYANVLQERAELRTEQDRVFPAVYEMALGNPQPFFDLVQKSLEILSNRDFQRFDEKYVKMLIIAYAMQGGVFFISSERETQGGGYVDIEMDRRPSNTKKHTQYVFEVKYLPKAGSKKLKEIQAEAEKQLRHYLETDEILRSKENLSALTVVIVKDKVIMKKIN